jgi:molybdopterin/thiamine biosynthesis adenylyltransferase
MYNNVILVGLGGVGSNLFHALQRFLGTLESKPALTIIDGDTVERSNLARQAFGTNDVTLPKVKALQAQIRGSQIDIFSVDSHLNDGNIGCIADETLVISAVDNHSTNKMIQDHCLTLDNVVYICGTGHLTNGNVLTFARREGKNLLPPITEFHPEIADPQDRHPDEPSCMATADEGSPQLISTNVTGATVILQLVSSLYKGEAIPADVFYDVARFKMSPIGPVKTLDQLFEEVNATTDHPTPVVAETALEVEETVAR